MGLFCVGTDILIIIALSSAAHAGGPQGGHFRACLRLAGRPWRARSRSTVKWPALDQFRGHAIRRTKYIVVMNSSCHSSQHDLDRV